jgi:hypothetical protein
VAELGGFSTGRHTLFVSDFFLFVSPSTYFNFLAAFHLIIDFLDPAH